MSQNTKSCSDNSPSEPGTSLGHMPTEGEKWVFDPSVTTCFDDMLERSIPDYRGMREACFEIGSKYVKPKRDILDLGCSRGGAIAQFLERFGKANRYVAVEVSDSMREAAKTRFTQSISEGIIRVLDTDLRTTYPSCFPCLTLCVLTLQFTPIEYREKILNYIYSTTLQSGALILVEKVLGPTDHLNDKLVETYYDFKRRSGYTEEEIYRKRLALEGVLVPLTAKWNEDMLAKTGFRHIDCFWRRYNFAGWVAVK